MINFTIDTPSIQVIVVKMIFKSDARSDIDEGQNSSYLVFSYFYYNHVNRHVTTLLVFVSIRILTRK
jgi:hypothetical protein